MYIKKDDGDDQPMPLDSVSAIKPGKSQDQLMALDASPPEEDRHSDDVQPMKLEGSSTIGRSL